MRFSEGMILILRDFLSVMWSVLPLLLALAAAKLLLRSSFGSLRAMVSGCICLLAGLFLFQKGIGLCLEPMAKETGIALAEARVGRVVILAIFCAISYCAVLAEPALRVLVGQVEEISVGAVRSSVLILAAATGAAAGTGLGVLRILYNLPTSYIILPVLLVLLIVGSFAKGFFLGVAFDCAVALTGPVSIPINSLLAVGLASGIAGIDPLSTAFGLVGLSTLGAAVSVLVVSLL